MNEKILILLKINKFNNSYVLIFNNYEAVYEKNMKCIFHLKSLILKKSWNWLGKLFERSMTTLSNGYVEKGFYFRTQ